MTLLIESENELRIAAKALRHNELSAAIFLRVRNETEVGLSPNDIWPLCAFIAAERHLFLGGLVGTAQQADLLRVVTAYCAERAVQIPQLLLLPN